MKILHIYRFKPDNVVKSLTKAWTEGNETTEVHLYLDQVNYDRLVELIFQCDKVITW